MLTFSSIRSVGVGVDVGVSVGMGEADLWRFAGFFSLSLVSFVTKFAVESGRIN